MAAKSKLSFLEAVAAGIDSVLNPAKQVTPKLRKDPNTNILTTTTVQDARGDSYFAPESLEELPNVVKGGEPVTRKQVAQYVLDRELDAMPSRMGEVKTKRVMREAGLPTTVEEMKLQAGGKAASAAGRKTAANAKAASAAGMAEMGRYRGKDKGGVTSGSAPVAPAAPTRTRETLPSVDGPMRSISSGNASIFDTMSKAEMGRDRAIGELSSDSAAMRSSAAASPARDIDALFKKATGTTFDPKSQKDRAVRAELESVLNSNPELADKSDTKVALAWYANKRKK